MKVHRHLPHGLPKEVKYSNYGITLDGINQHIIVNDHLSLRFAGAMTLEAFFRPVTANFGGTGLRRHLISKSTAAGFGTGGYELEKELDNRVYFNKTDGVGGTGNGVFNLNWDSVRTTINSWIAGRMYYIVATWDGTLNPNGMKIYVNGVLDGQATALQNVILTNATPLYIGTLQNLFYWSNVFVDELRALNTGVSALEVRESLRRGYARREATSVLNLRIENGSGLIVYDTSGLGNNGTLVNNPPWIRVAKHELLAETGV